MKSFLNPLVSDSELNDTVFEAAKGAYEARLKWGDEHVVNGAFGTLFNEDGQLWTFKAVYDAFDKISNGQKAKYASSIYGSKEFHEGVKRWLFGSFTPKTPYEIIATPGGTGALASTVKNALSPGETLILPNIGWGPYTTIAKEAQVEIETYAMFDGDHFHLIDFKKTLRQSLDQQGKAVVFFNDPCQNPTGYSLNPSEWDSVFEILEELSILGPIVFVYDIAYVDFNLRKDAYKKNFERLFELPSNVLTVITFSASKTLSAYGMRIGAQVLISQNTLELRKFKAACGNTARGVWSTINNGGMALMHAVATIPEVTHAYSHERDEAVMLLKQRANLFLKESLEVGLDLYPYKEGFFATIRIENPELKNEVHRALKEDNIFFVNIFGGLRVALCSIPLSKIKGLAKRVKDVMDGIEMTYPKTPPIHEGASAIPLKKSSVPLMKNK